MKASDLYEKIMSQGLRTIGRRMWQPTQRDKGVMSAQFQPGIWYSNGTASVAKMIIITMHRKQMMNESLKRCQMRGTSIQKVERSTT